MPNSITSTTSQLQFKGRMFSLAVLQIQGNDYTALQQQLQKLVQQAPKMFQFAPVVIDLESHAETSTDLAAICQLLKHHQVIPVGIMGGSATQQQAATQIGLALFPTSKAATPIKAASTAAPTKPATAAPKTATSPTKMIYQPVRSGQQIYAKNADLIILSSVSHGAEIIADGSIHVYGALHGRAIAGAQGDQAARIFCKKLDAELVSIAGIYLLSDDFKKHQKEISLQIYLENEKLLIAEL